MNELVTIRDVLRYAVSRFREAKLAHGHGAMTALDEAAFIILEALHLPVDDINPWLDARLLENEKKRLLNLVEARIATRKPAAYLLKRTYMHGVPFYVDERVIVPRSYIGELLVKSDITSMVDEPDRVSSILDLCTGSGCLAILAAQIFEDADVHAADLSADALEVAKLNVAEHGLEERITLHQGDLFAPLKGRKFDLIITNPPYVAQAEVDAFPAEYRAEPQLAHLGGTDGLDIVRRIIKEAPKHLNSGGTLVCEIGTGHEIISAEFPRLELVWLDTEQSEAEVFLLRS